jgi:hypothetical protein
MGKKLLFAVAAILYINLFFGQITSSEINGGNTSYSYRDYAPLNPYFVYNYTQMLYSASELTAAGLTAGSSISGLQFVYGVDAGTEGDFDDWVIYIGNTSKTSFGSTSSSEWISTANMTQVFNSAVSLGTAGASNWFTVNFTTNFTWDGTSNIVIAVDENSPNYATNTDPWKSTDPSGSNYEVLQFTSDATNPNPASPPTPDYRWSTRPVLKLKYTNCTPTVISSVSGTSPTTCGGTNGQITVNTTSTVTHYSKDDGVSWVASSSNSYIFNSLTAGSYTIKVRNSTSCITSYTSNPVILSNPANPPTPTAVNGSGCGTGTVQLGVTSAMNGTINWYSNSSLTTLVGSTPVCTNASPCTTTWTTPSISSTTSYWATRTNLSNCTSAAVEVIATVGNTSPTNVSAGSNTAICLGNSTSLSGSATGALLTHELYNENFNACSGLLNPSICGWTYGIFSNADSYSYWKISNACAVSGNALTLYDDWDGQDCDYDEYGMFSDPSIDFISHPQTAINATGYENLSLTFEWKCVGEVGYDYGNVMYSLDGATWNYATSTNYVNQNSWTSATISLPSAVNNTSFYIGFEWRNDGSDGGGVGSAFSVDNIRITGQKYAPVTYSWSSNPSGFSSSTNAPGSVTPNTTTTYTLTATSNGCSVSSPVVITVNQPSTTISVSGNTIASGDYLWNGNSTTDFSTLSNWFKLSSGNYVTTTTLPTSADNIFVVTSTQGGNCISSSNNPTVATSSGSVKNIMIGSGASLGLGSHTLNVSGIFTNLGTFSAGTGTVNFNGGTQTIPALSFHHLAMGSSGVKSLGGNINVAGSLQLNNGTLSLNGNTLTYSGNDFSFFNGNMNASVTNSKLKFTNSQIVTIPSGIFTGDVYNLEVAGTANVVADNSFSISNNLNLISSNFVISDGWDVIVKGSISKTSGSAISLGATQSGKIIFEGTSIDLGTTDNLQINRTAVGDIQVNGNLVVNRELALVNGVVALGTNNLTLNGTLGSVGTGAYIKTSSTGKFIRKTAATGVEYLFPVGQSYYTPIKITFTGGVGTNSSLTSRVVSGLHPDAGPSATSYARTNYYWEMNSSNMTNPTYSVTLKYNDNSIINAGGETEMDLRPAKYSSTTGWLSSSQCTICSQGTILGTSTLNTTTNEIVWSGVSGFSDFAGFGQGSGSPLPVELMSFSANCQKEGVQLNWQTASEFNASHFNVEKSKDGLHWDEIGQVNAAGNSNSLLSYFYIDRNEISGVNYYRLRQVDIDGTEKEFGPILTNCESESPKTWMSYPNPSQNGFQVICDYDELVGEATLYLTDASGKLVANQAITMNDGMNLFVINQELTPGIYFLTISNGSKSTPVLRHAVK